MLKHLLMFMTLVVITLGTSSCSYFSQFTRVEPGVIYTTEGPAVHSSPIGQVFGEALLSTSGPVVHWHTGGSRGSGGDLELAPNIFDLGSMTLTNGRYRSSIVMSVVPRGIVRTISVVPINHTNRVSGPSERSGWKWTTRNHYDGAWYGYKLVIQYQNTMDLSEFEYWILSSPGRYGTSPY